MDYIPMWMERRGKGYQYFINVDSKVYHSAEPSEFGLIAKSKGKNIKFMGLKT